MLFQSKSLNFTNLNKLIQITSPAERRIFNGQIRTVFDIFYVFVPIILEYIQIGRRIIFTYAQKIGKLILKFIFPYMRICFKGVKYYCTSTYVISMK